MVGAAADRSSVAASWCRIASLEAAQLGTGLNADLVHQTPARVPVGLERVGLPPGSVQREHLLTPEALAQWMLAHECLELAHQPRVLVRGQIRVDPLLERGQTGFIQPRDLRLREWLVGEVHERRTPPYPECLAQDSARGQRVSSFKRVPTLRH